MAGTGRSTRWRIWMPGYIVRDTADLADLLRMGRLPEAWIAPPALRELREMVRHRAGLVAVRDGEVRALRPAA